MSVNSIYLTVEKAAHLTGAMLLMVGVARLLGDVALDDYAYVISLTALFVPILDVGLNNRVIKAVASGGPEGRAAATDAVAFKLALAPVALVVMGAVAWGSGQPPEILAAVLLVGGSTVAMSLGDAVNSVFKGLQRPVYSVLLVGGLNVLLFGTAVWAMTSGRGLVGVGACYLLCRSGYLGAALGLIGRVSPDLYPAFRPAFRKDLILQGLRHLPAIYFLGNLLNLNYITTYLMVGEAGSGQFAIGYRLAVALCVLATANLEAILPALTRRFQETVDLKGSLVRAFWTLLGVTLLGVGLVQVGARPVTVWVFGAGFEPSVAAVRVLAWTAPPFALCGLAHTALLAMDRGGRGMLAMLALLVVGTGLGLAAVRFWGAEAAALAPTITGCVFAGILWGMVWKAVKREE